MMDYMRDCDDYATSLALFNAVERFNKDAKDMNNDADWELILQSMREGLRAFTIDHDGYMTAEAWVGDIYGVMQYSDDTFTGHRTLKSMRSRMIEINPKWSLLDSDNSPMYNLWTHFLNRGLEW